MKDDWYCKTMGMEFGPMSFSDLAGLAARGNLRAADVVRQSQAGEWIKAGEVPGLIPPSRELGIAQQVPAAPSPAPQPVAPSRPSQDLRPNLVAEQAAPLVGAGGTVAIRQSKQAGSLALAPYNCAILIGPGGISICDLRDCQDEAIARARVVGHRSAGDDAPIRFESLELDISVREVGDATPHAAAADSLAASAAGEVTTESPIASASSTRSKGAPKGSAAETGDIAAAMLRRMFMPRPSKAR